MDDEPDKQTSDPGTGEARDWNWGLGVALGLSLGAALGAAFGDIAVGVALGVAFFPVIAMAFGSKPEAGHVEAGTVEDHPPSPEDKN